MALKSIIRKRRSETQLDGGPSPSRVRFNNEIQAADICEFYAINQNSKMTFNGKETKQQYFSLPKPIMNYLLKAANAKVIKKFYRSCKYIYQRNPMCIVDEMNDEGIEIGNKWHQKSMVPMIHNIWITKKISFENFDSIIGKIVRCDAKWIDLTKCQISIKLFEVLAKSKNIYFWDSRKVSIVSADKKPISLQDLLIHLPNTTNISAIVNSSLNSQMVESHANKDPILESMIKKGFSLETIELLENKIRDLKLTIIGNIFDPEEYCKVFEKVLAHNGNVRLDFQQPNQEAAEICREKCKKLKNDFNSKWKPANTKPKLNFKIYKSNSL